MKPLLFLVLIFTITTGRAQTAEGYYNQSRVLSGQKDYPNAILAIDKALGSNAQEPRYYISKAECYRAMDSVRLAYEIYCQAIAMCNDRFLLYINRGALFVRVRQFDDAIEDFTLAFNEAKFDSCKVLALANRAGARQYKRDFKNAYDDLLAAYKIDSTDLGVLTNLGAVCDEVGSGNETLKYLLKAVQINPQYYEAYANIGFKYQEMGQYKKAIEYYDKVVKLNPKEALGYSNRAYNKLKLNDLAGAITDVNESLELYPGNAYAYRIRALIYIAKKEFGRACTDLETALGKGFTTSYGDEVENLQKQYCTGKK
jgi:tetratricopeptide (TPR) repeat protein